MSEKVITPIFRVSFPHLLAPKISKKQDPKTGEVFESKCYEVTMIFDQKYDDPKEQARLDAVKKLVNDTINEKYPNLPKGKVLKKPLRPGVQKTEERMNGFDLEKYPEYAGKIIASARSYGDIAPDVVCSRKGPDGKFLRVTKASEIYAGVWARATLTGYISKAYPDTVSLGLQSFFLVRPGEPIGGARGNADSDFEGFEDEGVEENEDLLTDEYDDIPF